MCMSKCYTEKSDDGLLSGWKIFFRNKPDNHFYINNTYEKLEFGRWYESYVSSGKLSVSLDYTNYLKKHSLLAHYPKGFHTFLSKIDAVNYVGTEERFGFTIYSYGLIQVKFRPEDILAFGKNNDICGEPLPDGGFCVITNKIYVPDEEPITNEALYELSKMLSTDY